jgi:hypothetical protein
MTVIGLDTPVHDLFEYAMRGDRSDPNRSNFREAMAVLEFQLLAQQRRAATAQLVAAIATALLVAATAGLILVT